MRPITVNGIIGIRWAIADYILAEDQLLQVGLVSMISFVPLWIVLALIISIIVGGLPGAAAVLVGGILSAWIVWPFARQKRRRISKLPPEEIAKMHGVKQIPWTDVTKVEFKWAFRGKRVVRIWIGKRTKFDIWAHRKMHSLSIKESQVEQVREFLKSKYISNE